MVSLQLARRLISVGVALIEHQGPPADEAEIKAEAEIKQMIVETMVVHYRSASDIYERLIPAIRSSRRRVNNLTRRSVEAFARREMPYCYLCGTELDFLADDHGAFTLDHVWPRAYGGNSHFENLLGACQSCNRHKSSAPSWAMYPIQSYVAGYDGHGLEDMPKEMRFAVQARAAKHLANREHLSLREAYIRLGRPGRPVVVNGDTAVDLFNLEFSKQ